MRILPLVLSCGAGFAQDSVQSRLRQGAEAFNAGDTAAAVEQFRAAVALDPAALLPRLHLAHAYTTRRAPDQAREAWRVVLDRDPSHQLALWGLAMLEMDAGNADSAGELCRKLIALDPRHAGAHYTLGVIRWHGSYQRIRDAQRKAGGSSAAWVKDPVDRRALQKSLLPAIQEGVRRLERAMALGASPYDSMAFINLLYRAQSRIVDTEEEIRELTAKADDWLRRAIESRPRTTARRARLDPTVPPPPLPPPAPPPPPPPSKRG